MFLRHFKKFHESPTLERRNVTRAAGINQALDFRELSQNVPGRAPAIVTPRLLRLAGACLLFTGMLGLSACSPRREAARGENALCEECGSDRKPAGFFGVRFDDSIDARRRERAERMAGDPCATPSYKELRQARALARMEADLANRDGYVRVLPDGSASNPDNVRFAAVPGALNIEFTAADDLNAVEGLPHALTLAVYQLSDRVALDGLLSSPEGVAKLLAAERFDESVKSARQLFIQPGAANRLSMERADGARHVAIVAGYHHPEQPSDYARVFSYGIGQYSVKGPTLTSRNRLRFRPLPLNLRLALGPDGMSAWETTRIFHNMHDAVTLRSEPYYGEIEAANMAILTP